MESDGSVQAVETVEEPQDELSASALRISELARSVADGLRLADYGGGLFSTRLMEVENALRKLDEDVRSMREQKARMIREDATRATPHGDGFAGLGDFSEFEA